MNTSSPVSLPIGHLATHSKVLALADQLVTGIASTLDDPACLAHPGLAGSPLARAHCELHARAVEFRKIVAEVTDALLDRDPASFQLAAKRRNDALDALQVAIESVVEEFARIRTGSA